MDQGLGFRVQGWVRWTPHPVIVAIGDNRDYLRVLLYSYYTTITGRGVLLNDTTNNESKDIISVITLAMR